MSTPSSSPTRRIVNIVSSPGPMGPLPDEEEYDNLPFKLPPGPYSNQKPDLPYAALIGQAILSSPEHRLTLQEIYDWITIVYPYFKRNEQTWMNSIRHVLSTTIVFRKVQRDRSVGRTLWAIFDRDLECFSSGLFRKEFCSEMQEQKARYTSKKRPADDSLPRKSKRSRKAVKIEAPPPLPLQMGIALANLPTMSFSAPIFPQPRPGTHHQPYYPPPHFPLHPLPHVHTLPAGVIFPTLPPNAGYHKVTAADAAAAMSLSTSHPPPVSESTNLNPFVAQREAPQPPTPLPPSSSASIPELIPNCSSSSPLVPAEGSTSHVLSETKSSELNLDAHIIDAEDLCLVAIAPSVTLLDGDDNASQVEAPKLTKSKAKAKDRGNKKFQSKVS